MWFLKFFTIISLIELTSALTQLRESGIIHGCNECALTGNCDHAYRNSSGQLCLILQNDAPCCCPLDAACVTERTDTCLCTKAFKHDIDESYILWISIGVFVMLCLCLWKCGVIEEINNYHINRRRGGTYAIISSGNFYDHNYGTNTFRGDTGTSMGSNFGNTFAGSS